MSSLLWQNIAAIIEFIGALIITGYAVWAGVIALRGLSTNTARLILATGVITGLDFKLAATLLKTITLMNWQQISMFSSIFAIRLIIKRIFTIEQKY